MALHGHQRGIFKAKKVVASDKFWNLLEKASNSKLDSYFLVIPLSTGESG
jgi:hypothetical protein